MHRGFRALALEGSLIANSAFAYGRNDGAVWSGRGMTALISGGVAARSGRFSVMLKPVAFVSQNASFSTGSPNQTRSWAYPGLIDLPGRFGSSWYARIDPGESEVKATVGPFAAGLSTRLQVWGPAIENPLILGNNAAGIPRAFIASDRPIVLGPFALHGQIIWGRLSSSGYVDDVLRGRMLTAAVGSVAIPAIPGLEFGGIRLFHVPSPATSLGDYLKVFDGLLKVKFASETNPSGSNEDNQLASAFIRWSPPGGRFELYGEYGREDHSWNLRDFLMEPDHNAGFVIGFSRVFGAASEPVVLRAEHLNTRLSHLGVSAAQTPWYLHTRLRQGHTQRGQVLGSPGGPGGGASMIAVDRYETTGRTTVRWDRLMQAERVAPDGLPEADEADVLHALSVERLRSIGRGEIGINLSAMLDFNRHFSSDRFNLNAGVMYRLYP